MAYRETIRGMRKWKVNLYVNLVVVVSMVTYGSNWSHLNGKGFVFVDEIVGGVVPKEYISSVAKGIEEQMNSGVLAGYPVLDIKATLFDGSYHDVDSNEMAFKIAGQWHLKRVIRSTTCTSRANDECRSNYS